MKRRLMIGAVFAAALLTSAALVACGGDDDGDGDGGDTTPAASTQPASPTEPAVEPTTASGDATEPAGGDATEPADAGVARLAVQAADFSFTADRDDIPPGAVVQVAFANGGSAPHTLTFYTDEGHTEVIPGGDSGQVAGGGSVNFTFEAPESGSAFYRCEVHPSQMEGELTIE